MPWRAQFLFRVLLFLLCASIRPAAADPINPGAVPLNGQLTIRAGTIDVSHTEDADTFRPVPLVTMNISGPK